MASKSKSSRTKQAAQKKGYDSFNPQNPPVQPEQEETGAASSPGMSGQKLSTWGTYDKTYDAPSTAQTEHHQHQEYLSSQKGTKGTNPKASQAEKRKSGSADPSVGQTEKQKSRSSSISKRIKKKIFGGKGNHSATVTPGLEEDRESADISQIEEDEMEHQEDSSTLLSEHSEEQIMSPGRSSVEETNTQFQILKDRLEHDLDDSKRALANKEVELNEAKANLEKFTRRRVEWQTIIDTNKAESEKLKKENTELNLKIAEEQLKSDAIGSRLKEKTTEVDKLREENQDLNEKVKKKSEDKEKELHKKEVALAAAKKSYEEKCSRNSELGHKLDLAEASLSAAKKSYEEECKKHSELGQKLDEAEAKIEELVTKVTELESELSESKKVVQEKSDKLISVLENNSSCVSETSKRMQILQEQLSQRDSELTKYKEKLQLLETKDREVAQQRQALQMGSSEANAKLKRLQEKLDCEKQKLKESELELGRVKEEEHHKIVQMELMVEEYAKSLKDAHEKVEKLASEKDKLEQRLDHERSQWSIKVTEEKRALNNLVAELERQLEAKTIALEDMMNPPLELEPFPSPGKDEMKHGFNLSPKNLTGEKSKSLMQLQSKSLEQPPSEAVSHHSSAPSSLRKESLSTTGASRGDQQDEKLAEFENYESPHTSLNQVAGKVTVNEENMTDAVKASIQNEVIVLQNKLQTLERDNDCLKSDLHSINEEKLKLQLKVEAQESKILSDLELMETERCKWQVELKKLQADNAKLDKVKSKYLDMVEERTKFQDKVLEVTYSDPPTNSISEIPVVCLEDKDKQILELKEQLEELRAKSRDMEKKMQQWQKRFSASETYEGVDVESSLDFRQMHSTFTSEITSMRRRLSRAESEQTNSVKELYSIKEAKKQLEEENSKLKMEYDQLLQKAQFWQQQCEKRGDDIQSLSKEAESKASQLQGELELSQDKNVRFSKEIEHLQNSVVILEERLELSRQDRDRQHDQIMKLIAVKSGLDKELQNLGKVQVESQHYKHDLETKVRKVITLQQEKLALIEQIDSLKEEIGIKNIEIAGAKEDFEAERSDRQKLASQLDSLKAKAIVNNQQWKAKLHHAEQQTQFYFNQLEDSQNVCARERQSHEDEVRLLSDQIEEMQTEHEEKLRVTMDQMIKEADAKLRKHKVETLKEINRLTELLQSSKDDFHSQLAGAETEYRELQREYDKLVAENSQMKRDFAKLEEQCRQKRRVCEELEQENLKIQTEMTVKNSSLESEIEEIKTERQATIGKLQSKIQALISGNQELEHKLHEMSEQHAKEKQRFNKQLQNIDVVRKVLKTQLDTEVQRAEEATKIAEISRSEVTTLSRELDVKDQINGQLQRELKFAQDRLSETEFKNAQMESEMKKMTIQKVGLERERNNLYSRRIEGEGQNEVFRQLIAERDELEAKYSKLLDDYRMMQQLAIRHGLRIPQRRDEANPPFSSDSDVRPFDQDAYHGRPPMPQDGSRRYYTTYVSGVGPTYHGQQQLLTPDQGARSPGSRNRQGSNDPSNMISENELAQGIDHDIAEAAAHMEEKEIHTTMVSMTDARPLDSNLICPLCGKQFRIGQIQHYRLHVDNCSKNPN